MTIASIVLSTLLVHGKEGAESAGRRRPPNSAPSFLANGRSVPASFLERAFAASGPFFQKLPAHPKLDPSGERITSYYFAGNPPFNPGWIDANRGQERYDYSFPLYQASARDPKVKIVCAQGGVCADAGARISLPALAKQAGGSDAHLAVIEPGGVEYDFWEVSSSPPYKNGSSLRAAGEARFSLSGRRDGKRYVAPGFSAGAATAGGIALSIGQVYTSELAAGVIKHALSLTFPCATNTWVYPASQATGVCGNGEGMPLGARVWWEPDDARTRAMPISRDMKTILIALHHYGGFYTDSFGGVADGRGKGMGAHLENQEAYWLYGKGADPALSYAAHASGWNHVKTLTGVDRYVLGAEGGTLDFLHNLKVLAPCVTQKRC